MRVTEEECTRDLEQIGQKDSANWSGASRPSDQCSSVLRVGARSSPLSKAQVDEVRHLLGPQPSFIFVETTGDKDRLTSLRSLGKTDFFTRELDQMLLENKIDVAIHSAKDLPDPLPKGLKVAYLSPCIDSRDSLVIKKKPVHLVATSSKRREEMVKELYPGCKCIDLRGTIHERLNQDVDGVVVAEAALLRLKLKHLERVFLPGNTTPLQGRIAIVTREDFVFRAKTS